MASKHDFSAIHFSVIALLEKKAVKLGGQVVMPIHDAVQVIGYFNYITRIADALGVEPETFIKPWGV